MARDDPYFRLRIPEPLLDQIREASESNRRSATAEMIARLESTFTPPETAQTGVPPITVQFFDKFITDKLNEALAQALDARGLKPSSSED